MNRYPLWKYLLIAVALVFGILYMVPNFFGDSPALQITSGKATVKVTASDLGAVEAALQKSGIKADSVLFEQNGQQGTVRARFHDTDTQFKAKAVLERDLNRDPADPTYYVAFNLLPNTPNWLQSLHAAPMYLGLDLRGGVHFLMQVDVKQVIEKRVKSVESSSRTMLRDKNIRHAGIARNGNVVEITFRDADTLAKAKEALLSQMSDVLITEASAPPDLKLVVALKEASIKQTIDDGVGQNISTLAKRVNELGVAEPLIQRQGADRIVVEMPGVQDVSRAKDIIGRTATLEIRLVDESVLPGSDAAVPFGSEAFKSAKSGNVVVYKDAILTGDSITNASAAFDESQRPAVSVDLNSEGGRKMREATRSRIGKHMAIILFEKKKGEVLSNAVIQDELGSRFRITGAGTTEEANDLALLLRAGSLAAPMEIIEERTIGPQLGAENIQKGFNSTLYGFAAIAVFMVIYYALFGFFSVFSLAVNLMLLIAILSVLQATLTLPGIAAIAFTLGMAIDANVLINERIREELRNGNSPQSAISAGFDRAWATILDSNVTTLIAGLALLVFGSGAIRGFAVVHCLGIMTSIFSSVFVMRGLANLWYGRKKKLTGVSIGQIWKPEAAK